MVADEAELGQQRPHVGHRPPGRVDERAQQGRGAGELGADLFDLADDDAAAELGRARCRLDSPEDHVDQRRLAGPVRADDRDPVAELDDEVDGPEPERAAVDGRTAEAGHDVAAAVGGGDVEAELPRLAGLLDHLEPVDRPLRLGRLAGELFGLVDPERPDVLVGLVTGRPAHLRPTLLGPLALALRPRRQRAPLRVVLVVALLRPATSRGALAQVRLPAATEHRDPVGELVDLRDVGHDPVEEATVVAHQRHRGVEPQHPRLEHGQALEIEVVGRLVEEVHVESRQQQGRQPDPGRLATRQVRRRLAEQRLVEAEVVGHGAEAGVEVGRAERAPAVQRRVVPLGRAGVVGCEPVGGRVEFGLDAGDTRAAPQGRRDRLTVSFGLLCEQADGGAGRRRAHLAAVGHHHAGADIEQGRLADAVGADDADPVPGREQQLDVGEDHTGTTADRDVVEGEGSGHLRAPFVVGPSQRVRLGRGRCSAAHPTSLPDAESAWWNGLRLTRGERCPVERVRS